MCDSVRMPPPRPRPHPPREPSPHRVGPRRRRHRCAPGRGPLAAPRSVRPAPSAGSASRRRGGRAHRPRHGRGDDPNCRKRGRAGRRPADFAAARPPATRSPGPARRAVRSRPAGSRLVQGGLGGLAAAGRLGERRFCFDPGLLGVLALGESRAVATGNGIGLAQGIEQAFERGSHDPVLRPRPIGRGPPHAPPAERPAPLRRARASVSRAVPASASVRTQRPRPDGVWPSSSARWACSWSRDRSPIQRTESAPRSARIAWARDPSPAAGGGLIAGRGCLGER